MEYNSKFDKFIYFPVTRIFVALVAVIVAMTGVQELCLYILKITEFGEDVYSLIAAALASASALAAYIVLFRFYEKRKIEELSFAGFGRNALAGLLAGFAILSLVILIMYIGKAYSVTAVNPVSFLFPALAMAISSAVFEEILFRGIIFRIAESKLGSVWALVISSSFFGMAHLFNPGSTLYSAVAITVEAGLQLGAAYIFSKNLWLPIFIHFAWNLSEGGIYGAIISGSGLKKSLLSCKISGPDLLSGGTFGPENSLQAVILGLVTAMLFLWMAKNRGNFVQPYWKQASLEKRVDIET